MPERPRIRIELPTPPREVAETPIDEEANEPETVHMSPEEMKRVMNHPQDSEPTSARIATTEGGHQALDALSGVDNRDRRAQTREPKPQATVSIQHGKGRASVESVLKRQEQIVQELRYRLESGESGDDLMDETLGELIDIQGEIQKQEYLKGSLDEIHRKLPYLRERLSRIDKAQHPEITANIQQEVDRLLARETDLNLRIEPTTLHDLYQERGRLHTQHLVLKQLLKQQNRP